MQSAKDHKYVYYIISFDWRNGNWTQVEQTLDTNSYAAWAMDSEGKTVAVSTRMDDDISSARIQTYKYHPRQSKYEFDGVLDEAYF